jgi:exonuclease SbcD
MMLRVLHCGDFHLSEGPRVGDTLRCLEALVDDGIAQGVQLWLVGGDLTGTTVPHRATILERNTLAALFQRMAAHAPVVVTSGNHDAPQDIAIYGRLDAPHPIVVAEAPTCTDVAGARLFLFPYPWKGQWLRGHAGLTIEEQDRAVEADLRALLGSWQTEAAEARTASIPTIFLGHVTIAGCAVAGGEVIPAGREITLSTDDLAALGVDYVALSHVHLGQEMAPGIWYAGSPSRSNFGEADQKGHLIVDVLPGQLPQVHRRLTPARRFVTLRARWEIEEGRGWVWDPEGSEAERAALVDGAEVRVLVTLPEEAAETCPTERLAAELTAHGAHAVAIERRVIPQIRQRLDALPGDGTVSGSEQFLRARGAGEKLAMLWRVRGDQAPPAEQQTRCLARLAALEEAAIQEAA